MIALATVSGPLPKVGIVVVSLLVAGVLLAREPRGRALATLGALVLAPVLLAAELWNSPQLSIVHRHSLYAAIGVVIGVLVLVGLARLLAPRRTLIAPLAVFALPFRVPIMSGGTTSNLLVPLYLVVAVGCLAWLIPILRDEPRAVAAPDGSRGWAVRVERLLALMVVLYAVQSVYSSDFEKALQQVVFFYVPFALLYRLLRDLEWDRATITRCLRLLVALALVFTAIAFVEYATRTVFLSTKLAIANDYHAYFTVNSVFYDPDIFGRFLALTMILVAVLLIYDREQREQAGAVVVLALLWTGLVLTLSRSSLGALLVGLGVLAALRWRPGRALVIAVAVVLIGAVAVVASPRTFGLNQGIDGASSGRGGLVSGGVTMFGQRPIGGFGSASFTVQYGREHHGRAGLTASHTIPVTIAAEQGIVGELAYLALVICALVCLIRRARGDPVRSAVGAAFAALMFHTLLYADFLEDPVTWALLGVGVALSVAVPGGTPPPSPDAARSRRNRPAVVLDS